MATRRARALAATVAALALIGTAAQAAPAPRGDGAEIVEHSLRPPVTDENFYFVMADRFANGDEGNDTGGLGDDPLQSGFDPTRANHYQGGDIAGILEQLDYIEGLGTTAIWLTPSFRNRPVQIEEGSPSAGYHGYWVTDFTSIDPHLGTNEELVRLVDEAHARGMKVFFDIITNHTADVIGYEEGARQPYVPKDEEPYRDAEGDVFDDRDYAGTDTFPELDAATSFPYTPVLEEGEEDLKVPEWLNDVTLYHHRGDTTFTGEDAYYGDFFGLDDLFTEHPQVVQGMIDIYQTWVTEVGIDGYRIDTMKHVDDEFWQAFGPAVLTYARDEADKPEFFMFGEVLEGSRPFTSHFTTTNDIQAVLDFPFQGAARTFASQGGDAGVLEQLFLGDDWYTDADSNVYQMPTFLGNHDIGRIGAFLLQDNPGADEQELLDRSRLAHELMYLSRGNPVVFYGDEQGFTGTLGFEGSRQTMFPSQVEDYLDDELIGTESTHAEAHYDPDHPLYQAISGLADLTVEHPALRDGAHQHRYASDGPGVYAFSRIDHEQQREYVVLLNNSEEAQLATVETFASKRPFRLVYGEAAPGTPTSALKAGGRGQITVTVPALSTLVYMSSERIPGSPEAPAIALADPAPAEGARGRMHVLADVGGSSFYEVTFQARIGGGDWTTIGTDDTAPYQVFHDVSELAPGTSLQYRAAVLDNGGHTRVSATRSTSVPAPALTIRSPREGATVSGTVAVEALAEPERATHEVTFERSVMEGEEWQAWEEVGTDDSSPVYGLRDDVSGFGDGTQVRYRATLTDGPTTVTSEVRTVTVGQAGQLQSVTAAGSFNSEIGCGEDWQPACEAAMLSLDAEDEVWRLTVTLPAGSYEYKAALNGSWDVSYGADGALDGANIPLSVPTETEVTFTYDHSTHVISHTLGSGEPGGGGDGEDGAQPQSVTAAGSFNSEIGCTEDWLPACEQARLTFDAEAQLWRLTVTVPAGNHEYKAALDGSWTVNYGADGALNGSNIPLALAESSEVTFTYDHSTHVISHEVGAAGG